MYDATVGRWNGVDALGDSFFTWSPYHYAVNNPVSVIDPNGKDTLVVHLALNTDLSNKYFNVFDVTFSLVVNGVEYAVESDPLFMFSNKESDEKGDNSLSGSEFYGISPGRRESYQSIYEADTEGAGAPYKNEFNIYKINSDGSHSQIGRGIFIHYGTNYRHFDGCKGLCEMPRSSFSTTIASRTGSISALEKMQQIFDQYADRLTGQKSLVEPNSQVVGRGYGPRTLEENIVQQKKKANGIDYRYRLPLN